MQNKGENFKRSKIVTIKRLLSYIFKQNPKCFTVFIILTIIGTLVDVASSVSLQILIDDYITPLVGVSNPNFIPLLKFMAVMFVIYMIGVGTSFANRVMVVITHGMLRTIRDELFCHMQKLPVNYFDKHEYGDIMSIYTNDTDALRDMISFSLPRVISFTATIIGVFIAMLATSIHLTCVVLVIILCMLQITKNITKKGSKYFLNQQNSVGKINGFIEEMINGQKVVKSFDYEDEVKQKFDILNKDLCDNATKANAYVNILMPLMGNISYMQYVLVAIVGGILAIKTNIGLTLGAIASFLQLSKTISTPINQISQQVTSLVQALAGAERIFNLLDEKVESDDGYIKLVNVYKNENNQLVETKDKTNMWAWKDNNGNLVLQQGDIKFKHVNFSYVENKPVLTDFGLYANPGQKVALIGATGSGKTTIANLLNRFYDINDGEILCDRIDIRHIKKDDLRDSIGMVLQDTNLFTGTIMENIRYGRLDATDEEVINASKLSHAHNFIEKLPHGYNTKISNNGEELSEGQRKLIAIAQAIVNNPPVLILDEATSVVDTRTEKLVQKGMDELMKGRTSFVIAHRLQTVKDADVILVIENGQIIERGKHQDLLDRKGMYYKLYTGAMDELE